ncbi:collagen-binding domain-containing protein [Pediococcus siamensis]|uniref:collagen-binding domain-containing protein n=1 Tax=Pediococcus siamensis TaxID=381829 RepID=UPI0039A39AEF
MVERKQTHFKMYKIGRRWVFACAVLLIFGGSSVAVKADTVSEQNGASSNAEQKTQATETSSASSDNSDTYSALQSSLGVQDNTGAQSSSEKTSSYASSSSATSVAGTDAGANREATSKQSESNQITQASSAASSVVRATSSEDQKVSPVNTQTTMAKETKNQTINAGKTAQSARTVNDAVKDGGNVYDDYTDLHNLLGVSSQFHIFAHHAELNAHTNGNIAVGNLSGKVNFGTNIIEELLDKDISYIQNIEAIAGSSFVSAGNTRTNKVVFGQNVEIDLSNLNRPKVDGVYIDHLLAAEVYQDKDGNVYIDFDKEFALLKQLSTSLSQEAPKASYQNSDFSDPNQRTIDVSDLVPDEEGHIVINLAADVLTSGTPLTLAGLSPDKDGNTIIINVDTAGSTDYQVTSQIKVVYADGTDRNNKETEDFGDNHLLWNFYDASANDRLATGTITVDRPFQGSVLAPGAAVVANQNLDGNIIADSVVVNSETHRWDLQDNTDNKKDPDTDYEKPVPPIIDVEEPDNGEYETPEHPTIDVEMPDTDDYENAEHPTIDVEMPNTDEDENAEHPTIDVELPETGENESDSVNEDVETELEQEFEQILKEPASQQSKDEEALLAKIDAAIAKAKAAKDQKLEAKLEALRARVIAALAQNKAGNLPQTGEDQNLQATWLGFLLSASLALFGLLKLRRRDRN